MFRFQIPIFLYCKKVFRIRTQGKQNYILKVKPEIYDCLWELEARTGSCIWELEARTGSCIWKLGQGRILYLGARLGQDHVSGSQDKDRILYMGARGQDRILYLGVRLGQDSVSESQRLQDPVSGNQARAGPVSWSQARKGSCIWELDQDRVRDLGTRGQDMILYLGVNSLRFQKCGKHLV